MFRAVAAAVVLSVAPAAGEDFDWELKLASGPRVVIRGAVLARDEVPCLSFGRTKLTFTFADDDGVAYAAVHVGALAARPVVSDRAETWLWIPDYAREKRAYRWRYEDPSARLIERTIPLTIDLVAGAGPLEVLITAKDGVGDLMEESLSLVPTTC